MFIMSFSMFSLTGNSLTNEPNDKRYSPFYDIYCGGKLIFLDFYTTLSHEKIFGQCAHVFILKLSHGKKNSSIYK